MAEADPLELEHMIGYTGEGAQSMQFHPKEKDTLVGYIGRLVLIANVHDKHQQEFLHGHNEEVTSLCLSPSGNLIASGQGSSRCVPNSEAMVIVWDWKTRQSIYRLIDLNDGIAFSRNSVTQLAFSADDRFLAGSDDQPGATKLAVWDMESGQVANLTKRPLLTFLVWGSVVQSERRMNRHPAYHFYAGSDSQIHLFKFEFDVHTMQYTVAGSKMAMPSSGLQRKYHCVGMHGGMKMMVAGSSAGELCVFNTETAVFRACIPVSCGGLLALQSTHDHERGQDVVFCGCGDGKLKLLAGQDLDWEMLAETTLAGQVRSLGLACDGALLLAGTSEGNIYILDAKTLAIVPMGADAGAHSPPTPCRLPRCHSPPAARRTCHTSTPTSSALVATRPCGRHLRHPHCLHHFQHATNCAACAACAACVAFTSTFRLQAATRARCSRRTPARSAASLSAPTTSASPPAPRTACCGSGSSRTTRWCTRRRPQPRSPRTRTRCAAST